MRNRWRTRFGAAALIAFLLAVSEAGAETFPLETKTLPAVRTAEESPAMQRARVTSRQYFFQQIGSARVMMATPSGEKKPDFAEVIKKEPEYVTKQPFRGVAALGSQHFGFVLDTAPPPPGEEGKEKAEEEAKEEESPAGVLDVLGEALGATPPKKAEVKVDAFTRLYFDRNHNGDLTDDEVIEATSSTGSATRSQSIFPPVELTVESDGEQYPYALTIQTSAYAGTGYSYARAYLRPACYREGEVELGGKKVHAVLVDYNANGRFDDPTVVDGTRRSSTGALYPTYGDSLYLESAAASGEEEGAPTTLARYYLGKVVCLEGKLFSMKIGPGGKALDLSPSTLPTGRVATTLEGLQATFYSELGVVEVRCDDSGQATLPAGEWTLIAYTLTPPKPPEPAVEEGEEGEEAAVKKPTGRTMLYARTTKEVDPIQVAKGKTTDLKFGPPFEPRVTAAPDSRDKANLSLGLALVGSGGEACAALYVNGKRPEAPEFTISTKDGEEVAAGKFKYG